MTFVVWSYQWPKMIDHDWAWRSKSEIKSCLFIKEQTKERQLREAMEQELVEKDKQLQDLLQKHQEGKVKAVYK